MVKENAVLLMKKHKEKGFDTYLITRPDGEHISVSIASYPDIHQAYNELYRIQDETKELKLGFYFKKINKVQVLFCQLN